MSPAPNPTPAPDHRVLALTLLDTWHVGSGRGEARHLDALVDRDAYGLPHVPGRMLKGLLRDAALSMVQWGHWDENRVERLFGSGSDSVTPKSGLIQVSNAELPQAERDWLVGDDPNARQCRSRLFMTQFQTRIDADTGIAAKGSLRGIEVVIPLSLRADIRLGRPGQPATAQDWKDLDALLPLVRAVGAHKTRGHGRARLAWDTEQNQKARAA